MTEPITTELILETMKGYVEDKVQVSPLAWLEAGIKLNALLGGECDKLVDLESAVAQLRLQHLQAQDKRNVSEAKAFVEASQEYAAMRRQKLRIDTIQEFIMLAKKYATLKDSEYHS